MAELKTKKNDASVVAFLDSVNDEKRKKDAIAILAILKKVTKEEPKMWGGSLIGFGEYHYKYESGREGDWFRIGFSPRKQSLVLYIMSGFDKYDELLSKLGKYKTGKACLYINKLEDINLEVLLEICKLSWKSGK
ncbi:MAG: DUF1801 domain-containing protein [Chitinophagales bacterium]|nr:DUF1801 domain-containing protein [Chitinophagales bacterium]